MSNDAKVCSKGETLLRVASAKNVRSSIMDFVVVGRGYAPILGREFAEHLHVISFRYGFCA